MKKILIKLFFIIVTCNYLTSCQQDNKTIDKSSSPTDSLNPSNNKTLSNSTVLTIDNELLKKYERVLKTDTISNEKKFIKGLLNVIHKFNGRPLDTTMLILGDIDGDSFLDSIRSRVHLYSDTVFVDSWWVHNQDTLWHYRLKNPYFSYNSEWFEFDKKNTWVTFATGIFHGIPEFYSIDKFEIGASVPRQMILEMGLSDLKEKGININSSDYDNYLKKFKGTLFLFEDPEQREGLYIWYNPEKCFITYYHA